MTSVPRDWFPGNFLPSHPRTCSSQHVPKNEPRSDLGTPVALRFSVGSWMKKETRSGSLAVLRALSTLTLSGAGVQV